jgi:hypothetical protein
VATFSAESPNLEVEGPQVSIRIGIRATAEEALTKVGSQIPSPVDCVGLIDTGASCTAVRKGLLTPLGLHPVGTAIVQTPTTDSVPIICPTFATKLFLPNGWIEVTVVETPLFGQSIDVLIGRDVLKHGLFIYQGHSSQFTLSF